MTVKINLQTKRTPCGYQSKEAKTKPVVAIKALSNKLKAQSP